MLTDIPKYIGEAETLFVAKFDKAVASFLRDNKSIDIVLIAVCKYDNENGFYLFGCDKNFETFSDFFYEDIDGALDDAKRFYQVDDIKWIQIK